MKIPMRPPLSEGTPGVAIPSLARRGKRGG